jgi:hypothetical protein
MREKFSATYGFFLTVSVIGVFTFFAGLYNILDQIFLLNEVPATKLFLLQETFDIGLCLLGILLFGFSELIHIGISIEQNTRRS